MAMVTITIAAMSNPIMPERLIRLIAPETGRLHIPKGDLDQYGQIFIPNDCTFGLFRAESHTQLYI